MKEERLICPTVPKLSTVTERCLKTKLQIYTAPRNGTYLFVGGSNDYPPMYRFPLAITFNHFSSIFVILSCGISHSSITS